MRRSPRKARGSDGWDDEAWASNSDDEDFVARVSTKRTPSAAWAGAMENDAYMHLPQDVPASPPPPPEPKCETKAKPAVDTKSDRMNVFVASWAERSMSLASPEPATMPGLDALIEDPMAILDAYRTQLRCAHTRTDTEPEPEPEPEPETSAHDESHDVGLQSSHAAPSAPAFDPLATSGDGIMMTLGDYEPPPPPPPPPPSLPPQPRDVPQKSTEVRRQPSTRTLRRHQQLADCLDSDEVDLHALRTLAWKGVPSALRPVVWPLLLGYLPATAVLRTATLSRKRAEYASGVERALAQGKEALDQPIWHQIHIDVPRTNPGIKLWQQDATQRSLERLLYVWAIRHPASGYVQGINDLATPFFEVFLSAYIDSDPEQYELAQLPAHALQAVEADTFWCLSKLLEGIQDNYIFAQPGIQRQLRRMGEIVARVDGTLRD